MHEAANQAIDETPANANAMPSCAKFERLLDEVFAEAEAFPASTERETGALLRNLVGHLRPRRVLELGTFKGATTIQFIRALPFAGETRVFTVDRLDVRSPALRKLDGFYSFLLGRDIDVLPALSVPFDFVYLDSVHTWEHTREQIAAVRAHNPSAVMAVHDVLSHPAVSVALAEWTADYTIFTWPTPPQPDGRINGLAILSPRILGNAFVEEMSGALTPYIASDCGA